MTDILFAVWVLNSIVAVVCLLAKYLTKKDSREGLRTDCRRCKWLITYDERLNQPVVCSKINAGQAHNEPTVCGYFYDYEYYQEGEPE